MVIRILEIDPVAQKCKEGICCEIAKVQFMTYMKKLTWSDKCMEEDVAKTQMRWFEETANPWNLGRPNWSNFSMARQRGDMSMKLSKLFEVELRAVEVAKVFPENFGTDLSADEETLRENCDRGPCLPLVRQPNLPTLYKNLLKIVSKFGKSDLNGG